MSSPTNSLIPPPIPVVSDPKTSPIPPISAPNNSLIPPMSALSNDASASATKRKRRTAEDAAEERNKREAKRTAKEKERKEKEEDTRRKQAENAVRLQLARKAKLEKTPRFTWTTVATEELVQLVSQLKFEHESVLEANPGFISWGKFFKENSGRKEAFDTLKEVAFDALDRRYKAICTTFKASSQTKLFYSLFVTHSVLGKIVINLSLSNKAIRDVCAETGGAGLLTQLSKYNMSQSVCQSSI